jgi:hypothetical protein
MNNITLVSTFLCGISRVIVGTTTIVGIVGRTITNVKTKDGIKFGILLEKTGHKHFNEFNCSQICYYNISKIEPTRKDEWISSLLRNHHYVIYASEPNKAVAFETALLEQDDNM